MRGLREKGIMLDIDIEHLNSGDLLEITETIVMTSGLLLQANTRVRIAQARWENYYEGSEFHVAYWLLDVHLLDNTLCVFGGESWHKLKLVDPCTCGEQMVGKMRMAPSMLAVVEEEMCRSCFEQMVKESPLAWRLYQMALPEKEKWEW